MEKEFRKGKEHKKKMEWYKHELAKEGTKQDIQSILAPFLGDKVKDIFVEYPDLKNYMNLDELLPNRDFDCKVILIENNRDIYYSGGTKHEEISGHWTCIIRQPNDQFSYYDSFGLRWDQEFRYIPETVQCELHEREHFLSEIIRASPEYNVKWSDVQMQYDSPDISTCWRHVAIRIIYAKIGMTNEQYEDKMLELQDMTPDIPSDVIIVNMTKDFFIH
jgi:hypothetical protein